MLFGFIGRVSPALDLKEAMDASMRRTHSIADRVARAGADGGDGFALPANPNADPSGAPVDLEAEMTALADEQIRFDTTAALLHKTYQSLHTSLRDH